MDICVLGLGENGHLAFNEPEHDNTTSFENEYLAKIVALEDASRLQQVHDTLFNYVTVTMSALLSAS